jgi:16S rRNA (adenine1518-N6/adenine1519-N6)-dimethyltransferase
LGRVLWHNWDLGEATVRKSRRQAFGQHFLASPSVLRRIVAAVAPRPGDTIIEIGAGKGVLTRALAAEAGRVIALEKDERLIPLLQEDVPGNVRILHADVLRIDFRRLLSDLGVPEARLAGSLPYSISSPLLVKILDSSDLFSDCVFLLQKEVVERIAATPGSKKFAPLSVFIQNAFETRLEFTVAPGSFSPPPKVTSALLSLRKRPSPLFEEIATAEFRTFLRAAFAERRKKLLNNLSSFAARSRLVAAFADLGLSENARAEELPAATFAALFRLLETRRQQ